MIYRGLVAAVALVVAAAAHGQGGKYASFVAKAKDATTRDLLDPGAAQFRGLGVYLEIDSKTRLFLCGEVNAKNAFGAFTGFRRFYADSNKVWFPDGEDDTLFDALRKGACYTKVADTK